MAVDLAALRRRQVENFTSLHSAGRKVVGYFCSYVPVEIIAASGAVPLRLSRGGHKAELAGARYLRADACSFCKSCLGNFEADPLYRMVDAVVTVNTCDMMRRLPESIERYVGKPVFEFYMPRTWEPLPHRIAGFRRQLDELAKRLGELTGTPPECRLTDSIREYNEVRRSLRQVDDMRQADRPSVKGSELLESVALLGLLTPASARRVAHDFLAEVKNREPMTGHRPRLLLGGSMLAEDDHWLVDFIEERADIVADFLCTGSRVFPEEVSETGDPIDAIARHYCTRVPCMHRRPNDALYAYARQLARSRRCQGLVYKTLLYCDPYNFEAGRLKSELGLPMLHIDSDYSVENREQVRTRVEAFLEML